VYSTRFSGRRRERKTVTIIEKLLGFVMLDGVVFACHSSP